MLYLRPIQYLIKSLNMLSANPLTAGRVMSRASSQAAIALSTSSRHFSTTLKTYQGVTLLQDKQNGFGFARSNPRPAKPRTRGVTEIRGPYYSVRAI